jgi:phosphatidylinositol alpha-1,6-mannosyltransferase
MSSIIDLLQPDGRVLFLTNDFPPRHGGIQTFVRQLCGELPAERVVVHAPRDPGAADHDARLPFPVVRDPRSLLLPTPPLLRRVRRTMRAHDVHQVVFGASVPLGVLAPRLRDAGAAWQVALTHGHEVWWAALPGTRHVLRHVARNVDVTTYVSEYTKDRLSPALAGESSRFVRLSPRADPQFHPGWDGSAVRERLGIPPSSLVVVCVARLVRRKGQDLLVRAWPEILRQFPDAHLVLVGDGPARARLQRLIARLDMQAKVTLTGAVDETPPYYAAADVFAMPVRSRFFDLEVEALGISYLEAAAMGLVVVPGRYGGAPEAAPNANRPPSR